MPRKAKVALALIIGIPCALGAIGIAASWRGVLVFLDS